MPTVYVGDIPAVPGLEAALRAAGFEVSREKTPLEPEAGSLSIVPAGTGITSSLRHEINNPLTAVLGFLQLLLRREDLPPEAREKILKVHEHGLRVRDLLRKPEPAGE